MSNGGKVAKEVGFWICGIGEVGKALKGWAAAGAGGLCLMRRLEEKLIHED